MQIQITERSLYPNSHLKGVVRIFIPNDPSNYGFWFPEELLSQILSKENIEKLYQSEETPYADVDQKGIDLIREKGIILTNRRKT